MAKPQASQSVGCPICVSVYSGRWSGLEVGLDVSPCCWFPTMDRSVNLFCFSYLWLCNQPAATFYNSMGPKIRLGSFSALHGIGWGHSLGCVQILTGLESSRRLHVRVGLCSMMPLFTGCLVIQWSGLNFLTV